VVLIYRGSWCPYCNAQLAGFSRAKDSFANLGVKVAALSVDDETASSTMVAKHHIEFPVGYNADADKVAKLTGAYTSTEPHHL
jgi:peroxiredoxin